MIIADLSPVDAQHQQTYAFQWLTRTVTDDHCHNSMLILHLHVSYSPYIYILQYPSSNTTCPFNRQLAVKSIKHHNTNYTLSL